MEEQSSEGRVFLPRLRFQVPPPPRAPSVQQGPTSYRGFLAEPSAPCVREPFFSHVPGEQARCRGPGD